MKKRINQFLRYCSISAGLCAMLLIFGQSVFAQCSNAPIGTSGTLLFPGNSFGQSFVANATCGVGNAFNEFTFYASGNAVTNLKLEIFDGKSTDPNNLRYTENFTSVPAPNFDAQVTLIFQGNGTGDRTFVSGQTYTILVTFVNGLLIVRNTPDAVPGEAIYNTNTLSGFDSSIDLQYGIQTTTVGPTTPQVVINEIQYNPVESGTDVTEFIELFNAGSTAVDLSGWSFTAGVDFTFPSGASIGAGEYVVVTVNQTGFNNYYGCDADYQWTSGGLSNGGEEIILVDASSNQVDVVDFNDAAPWPVGNNGGVTDPTDPDGGGPSIELTDASLDNNDGASWTESLIEGGTPGAANGGTATLCPAPMPMVVINEIHYNPDESGNDTTEFVELFNAGNAAVDLSGWSFTQGFSFTFPANSGIEAGGYVVVAKNKAAFNNKYGCDPDFEWATNKNSSDGLSNSGEDIILVDQDLNEVDVVDYDDAGVWPVGGNGGTSDPTDPDGGGPSIELTDATLDNNDGTNWTTSAIVGGTPGAPNGGTETLCPAPMANVVINEIHYNPLEGGTDTTEFVELFNAGNVPAMVSGWTFTEGFDFTFPNGTVIGPGEYVVITVNMTAFRNFYGCDADFQWTSGATSNSGEDIQLEDGLGNVIDVVDYAPGAPWPTAPNGSGPSLELIDPALDNSLPASWTASIVNGGTPGALNGGPVTLCFSGNIQSNVVINEIHYNPDESGTDTTEFVELFNEGILAADLSGWSFTQGFAFTFPSGATIAPGQYIVIAKNKMAFMNEYGCEPDYEWAANKLSSDGLSNGGEDIILVDAGGNQVDIVDYDDGNPWPTGTGMSDPDGGGPSIELTDATLDNNDGANWATSMVAGGTPGAPNGGMLTKCALEAVVINELHYNPTNPGDVTEFIELYNRTSLTIDLSNYTISDGVEFTFPAGATIEPFEYITIALNAAAFEAEYGCPPNYQWTSGQINNSGERVAIALNMSSSMCVDEVTYDDSAPWPTGTGVNDPDGGGPSIELIDPFTDNSDGNNWAASLQAGGTPGAPNQQTAQVGNPPRAPQNLMVSLSKFFLPQLNWMDASTREDGFIIMRNVAGTGFRKIDTVGMDMTMYTDSAELPYSTMVTYRVAAFNGCGDSDNSAGITIMTPDSCDLPAGVFNQDIGMPTLAGDACYDRGTYYVTASGADIFRQQDQFHYVYEELVSSGSITVKLSDFTNAARKGKAGVMIRESLDDDSRHVSMVWSPSRQIRFLQRKVAGDNTREFTYPYRKSLEIFLRLVREGNIVRGYFSDDNGATFQSLGPAYYLQQDTVYIGMAVTAASNNQLAEAVFTEVVADLGSGTSCDLPMGWTGQDIFNPNLQLPGTVCYDETLDEFSVLASGVDIFGTVDEFYFVHQTLMGDGEITGRVIGIDPTNAHAKAGFMMRQSLDQRAAHASIVLTPSEQLIHIERRTQGDRSYEDRESSIFAPVWLKVSRIDTLARTYYSYDKMTWVQLGDSVVLGDGPLNVGLAVTSRAQNALGNAIFDSVMIYTGGATKTGTQPIVTPSTEIKVYPNPFDQLFMVDLRGLEAETATLSLHNMVGQQVLRNTVSTGNVEQVQLADLPKGIYILRVKAGSATKTLRMIKQ
ncbi:MAG: lamin tail domain-containing protein [Bacteroidota bacterium]